MTSKSNILLLIVAVIIICGFVYYYQSSIKSPENLNIESQAKMPAATGNINGVVNSLIEDSVSEAVQIEEEENDTELITADSQEISDLGQSYNEKEF